MIPRVGSVPFKTSIVGAPHGPAPRRGAAALLRTLGYGALAGLVATAAMTALMIASHVVWGTALVLTMDETAQAEVEVFGRGPNYDAVTLRAER